MPDKASSAVHREKVLGVARRTHILDLLHQRGSVSVTEMAAAHGVSEETIRRDLQRLEEEAGISRTYGGAYVPRAVTADIPVRIRQGIQAEMKETIARLCERIIERGDTLMLDSSTTALQLAEHLRAGRAEVTVLTNSLRILDALVDCERIKVISSGGVLRRSQASFVGPAAVSALQSFHADKAFVSCVALDLDAGLTDADELEAEVRRTMLAQAREKLVMADSTKLGKTAFARIAPLAGVDVLVTEREPDARWMTGLGRRDVRCVHSRAGGQA